MVVWTRILSQRIIVGISLSAYFLELLRILHSFLFQFINCDQHLELVDICGSKEEIPVNSYEIPNLPTKSKQTNKYIPVLQKSLSFLKIYICDTKCNQYTQITDHFNLKSIIQFREGKLVMSKIHYSLSA